MCGIAGVVGRPPDRDGLAAMGQALRHRGPDDEGLYCAPDVGLAFRRLSILDLEGGRQPMPNEDGTVQVVFNGEIYNHAELRLDLCGSHRFRTDHSDTEVLAHGWEEWGEGLFSRLNGMFALAVWDSREQTLVLARDRYGIKPLYYAELEDGALAFASEVRPLHASGLVERAASSEGLLEYFTVQNVWGERSLFRGVRLLEPGCSLSWRPGRLTRRRFWDLTFRRSRRGTLASLAEEHRDILRRAVRRQIAADVPVTSYLSGGIDSTSITVASHQYDPSVVAYSCVFDLEGVGADRDVDEREFSRLVARTYGLSRVEHEVTAGDLPETLDAYVTALEDLRMGMGYPVYLIARRVARDAKVVLSGTGGDEYHAGYAGRFQELGRTAGRAARVAAALGSLLARGRRSTPGVAPSHRELLFFLIPPSRAASAFTPEFLAAAGGYDADAVLADYLGRCPSDDWRDRVLYVDAKTYLAGLLAVEDKVSMAHSLETRVPLLDNELVDFLLDVPFDHLYRRGTGKRLFRESVRPWVPDAVFRKPKMGFGPPDRSWYRGPLRPWIEDRLGPRGLQARGVFRPGFLRDTLDSHFSGRSDATSLLWSMLSFDAWCRSFGTFGGASGPT